MKRRISQGQAMRSILGRSRVIQRDGRSPVTPRSGRFRMRSGCPWLIRRFIDARAEFLYVPTGLVLAEAGRLGAVAYDIAGAPISHEWEKCSFDALLDAFELRDPALATLATIVRGADTDRLSLAPQSAGLLAFSLGLSRLHADDHAMLEAAMPLYDALFEWCRGAQGERHSWPAHTVTVADR